MRASDDRHANSALFIEDSGEYTFLECDNCTNTVHHLSDDKQPLICPSCKMEMFYKTWFSW